MSDEFLPYQMTVKVPGLPPSMNGQHGHFRRKSRERKMWRSKAAYLALGNRPFRPMIKVELEVIRHTAVPMDFDNLVASCKPLIDGLRDAGVIWNDDPKTILKREYRCEPAVRGGGMVEIRVSGTIVSEDWLRKEKEIMAKKMAKKAAKKKPMKKK